jgi:hypothetical protein
MGCALAIGGLASRWPAAWIGTAVFLTPAIVFAALALRPAIEIQDKHLLIGRRAIPWRDIRRVDQTHWHAPLAVSLTLDGEIQVLLIHAGRLESGRELLRHLRRNAYRALLDGIPYRQFWGDVNSDLLPAPKARVSEVSAVARPPALSLLKAPLLLPEDEAEVERLFQQLKSAGRLGASAPTDRDTPSLPQ